MNPEVPVNGYIVGYGRFIPEVYREILGNNKLQYTIHKLSKVLKLCLSIFFFGIFLLTRIAIPSIFQYQCFACIRLPVSAFSRVSACAGANLLNSRKWRQIYCSVDSACGHALCWTCFRFLMETFFVGQNHDYLVSVRAFNSFGESDPVITVARAGEKIWNWKIFQWISIIPIQF